MQFRRKRPGAKAVEEILRRIDRDVALPLGDSDDWRVVSAQTSRYVGDRPEESMTIELVRVRKR